MFNLTKPKYFIPVHGETRHLYQHANLAAEMGVERENIFIPELGNVIELTRKRGVITGIVPAGSVMIDGNGVGDIGSVVLRDRRILSEDGLFTVVVTIKKQTGELLAPPEIVSRGFVYVKSSEELLNESRAYVKELAAQFAATQKTEWVSVKNNMRASLKNFLYNKTKRRPMILVITTEV